MTNGEAWGGAAERGPGLEPGREPSPPAGPEAQGVRVAQLEFRGRADEYFRIWIVNILLTILTLGIYSAWAKVRKRRYFYRNTFLEGDTFDYHASPVRILKGRLIAGALLLLYTGTGFYGLVWQGLAAGVVLLLLPWMLVRSQSFNARNSSYRNLRFDFAINTGGAYRLFLRYGVLMVFTLGLAYPVFAYRLREFTLGHSRFGTTPFRLNGDTGDYYLIYLKAWGLWLLSFVMWIVLLTAITIFSASRADAEPNPAVAGIMGVVFVYVMIFIIFSYIQVKTTNYILCATALATHRLRSTLRVAGLLGIYTTNLLAIVLSFGLAIPWASVRLARYRMAHTALLVRGDLEAFTASAERDMEATGEEMSEFFDFDFGF